jgi:hypothetical protein
MILLPELDAQIHCLQLLSGIKRGLSPRMKARRHVLTRKTHSLEVLLRQLMVEILLQSKVSIVSQLPCLIRRSLHTQAKIPTGFAPSETESLASQAWPAKLEQQRQSRSSFSR